MERAALDRERRADQRRADLGGETMYRADGNTDYASGGLIYYRGSLDQAGGQSGSPIFRMLGGRGYLHAVVAAELPTFNLGVRIDDAKLASLNEWMAEDSAVRPARSGPPRSNSVQ